jgi:hypothetical protein
MTTMSLTVRDPQEMTVAVSGPGDANTLIICSGQGETALSWLYDAYSTITYTFLVGPALQPRQFIRAIASAAIAKVHFSIVGSTGTGESGRWNILSVDADWDDESGQVEVRVDVELTAGKDATINLSGLAYHVSILAAVPDIETA